MRASLLLCLLFLTHQVVGEEVSLPKPRAGLWQLQISAGETLPLQKMKVCIDRQTDGVLLSLNPNMPCSKRSVRSNAGRYIVDAACTMGNSAATIQTVISGDFQSAYSMDVVTRFDPPFAGQSEASQAIDGRWLGPCQGGQQPGEAIMADGTKVSLTGQ